MSNGDNARLDDIRRGLGERENHIIDEFRIGGISRRDFMRHASIVGMGIPLAGLIVGGGEASA